MKRGMVLTAVLVSIASVSSTWGAEIDFGGLTGANGAPMPSPYLEDGFSVTPVAGDFGLKRIFLGIRSRISSASRSWVSSG